MRGRRTEVAPVSAIGKLVPIEVVECGYGALAVNDLTGDVAARHPALELLPRWLGRRLLYDPEVAFLLCRPGIARRRPELARRADDYVCVVWVGHR